MPSTTCVCLATSTLQRLFLLSRATFPAPCGIAILSAGHSLGESAPIRGTSVTSPWSKPPKVSSEHLQPYPLAFRAIRMQHLQPLPSPKHKLLRRYSRHHVKIMIFDFDLLYDRHSPGCAFLRQVVHSFFFISAMDPHSLGVRQKAIG